jgi:hypothetical protein
MTLYPMPSLTTHSTLVLVPALVRTKLYERVGIYEHLARHVLGKISQATAAEAVFITYNGTEGKDETR